MSTLKLRFLLRKGHHPQISQLVDCERIFKIGLTLISRETLIPKKKGKILGNSIEKWAMSMKRILTEEETLMDNKYMKRYSTLLVIREKHIKPTMIYHFTPNQISKNYKVGEHQVPGRSIN